MDTQSNNSKDVLARKLLGNEHADKYVEPISEYDADFKVSQSYIDTLPDIQNGAARAAKVKITQVGIHNFRLPLQITDKGGVVRELEASVTGTVSLEAEKAGINMSRIMRTFYEHKNEVFSLETLKTVLTNYRKKLESFEARIMIKLSYPMILNSLRSGNQGWQYYDVILEGVMDKDGQFKKFIHLDFVYSSACPCSTELSKHAKQYRNRDAIPHSQRSVARVSVQFEQRVWIEELVELCRAAMMTETQVMVKREDEQAFAELNAANVKFVEDAVRQYYDVLSTDTRIQDFKVVASHLESLHSHDAVAVITKGVNGGFDHDVSYAEWRSFPR